MKFEVNTTEITRGMGQTQDWVNVPGITQEIADVLNAIGYGTIKNLGTCEEYLNSLNNGYTYKMVSLYVFDDGGGMIDRYMIISVREKVLSLNR